MRKSGREPLPLLCLIRNASLFCCYAVLDGLVELGASLLHVGVKEEYTDTEGKEAEDDPADEAEIKAEESPLVAVHHLTGEGDSLCGGHIRMLCQNEEGHGVGIALNDTGNVEEQGPEKGEQGNKKAGNDIVGQAVAEAVKNVLDLGLATAGDLEEHDHKTNGKGSGYEHGTNHNNAGDARNNADEEP